MFEFQDLFQWDRFITPTIIKTFYWLVIGLIVLFGMSGIFSGLAAMAISPFGGFIVLLSSIASVVVGVVFSRIAAEFILIVFRINEHLGAIRDQGGACGRLASPGSPRSAKRAPRARDRRGMGLGSCSAALALALRPEHATSSGIEPEMHHVAVGDDVFLAFQPQLAGVARAGFAAERDVIVIGDGLGADEALLEIGMDHAGRLRAPWCPR